jgi:hypothetical protein
MLDIIEPYIVKAENEINVVCYKPSYLFKDLCDRFAEKGTIVSDYPLEDMQAYIWLRPQEINKYIEGIKLTSTERKKIKDEYVQNIPDIKVNEEELLSRSIAIHHGTCYKPIVQFDDKLLNKTLFNVKKVFGVCEFEECYGEYYNMANRKNFSFVPIGYDDKLFTINKINKKTKEPKQKINIGFVGRAYGTNNENLLKRSILAHPKGYRKGGDILLNTALRLKQLGIDFKITILGQNWDELTKLVGEEHNVSTMVDPMIPNPKANMSFDASTGALSTTYGRNIKIQGSDSPFKNANLTRKVKAIMVYDTKENLDFIANLVNQFDLKRPQVLIAVRIVDINQKINEKLGLLPSFDGNSDNISVKKFGAMSKIQLDATLNFLETKDYLKTLSNPTIRAIDGITAKVQTGKEKTIRDAELKEVTLGTTSTSGTNVDTTSSGGTMLVNMWVLKKAHTGINMQVTPYVNGSNEVTMQMSIDQEEKAGKDDTLIKAYVSSEDVSNGKSPEADYPDVVEHRNFDTTIRMKDGETVVIGGLISENNNETNQKTPFISKLPVIGKLFSQNSKQRDRTEMVILVTPYIVNKDYAKKVELANQTMNSSEYSKFIDRLRRRIR